MPKIASPKPISTRRRVATMLAPSARSFHSALKLRATSNGDGRITVGELTQAVEECCRTAAWHAIEVRLRELDGRASASRKTLVSETDSAELQ